MKYRQYDIAWFYFYLDGLNDPEVVEMWCANLNGPTRLLRLTELDYDWHLTGQQLGFWCVVL